MAVHVHIHSACATPVVSGTCEVQHIIKGPVPDISDLATLEIQFLSHIHQVCYKKKSRQQGSDRRSVFGFNVRNAEEPGEG